MKVVFVVLALLILTGLPALAGCQELASPLEDYEWVLTSHGKYWEPLSVLPGTEITAFFDSETKEVSGSAGCNSYFGSYEVDHLTLTITGPLGVTEMWCGEEKGEQERVYLEALQAAESFRLIQGGLRIEGNGWQLNYKRR
ncbi:MAG: META domain-containing protein [Dehalococcoidales bacterium]|nr:META domain-containing protein [Dehalococcoidales bacterium]